MSTTKAALLTRVRRAVRDPNKVTWSDDELADLIGQGIDEINGFYPKEITGTVSIVAATYTYTLPTTLTSVVRADVYDTGGTFKGVLPQSEGNGPNGGWETWSTTFYVPRWTDWATGQTVRLFGYGPWTIIDANSATSASTDLDASGINALVVFCRVESFNGLVTDRAKFEQWAQTATNTDVTPLGMAQIAASAERQWQHQIARLRTLRKLA